MFQNDLIFPLDEGSYNPNKFSNFWFFEEESNVFWDMIEYNNNMHRYK